MFFLLQQCRIPDNRHFYALKLLCVPPTYIIIMVYTISYRVMTFEPYARLENCFSLE